MGPETKKLRPKKPFKKEICKDTVDRIVERRTFEPWKKPTIGCRFHRFNKEGESVTGHLGFPIKNFRQGTSYPLKLDNGEIVEIVGNRLLHKQIREGELCGRRVEIVYVGRDFTTGGGWRFHKIYRVYQMGHELIPKKLWNKIIEDSERAKNGKRRKKQDHILSELPAAGDSAGQ